MSKKKKKWFQVIWNLFVLVGAACFAVLAATLTYSGVLDQVDSLVSDAIYQWINHNKADTMVKIVAIDAATERELGEYESWSRSETARFIEVLNGIPKDAPNVIGFDLDYCAKKDRAGDAELEEVCKKYDNICLEAFAMMKAENSSSLQEKKLLENSNISEEESAELWMPYHALLPYVITGVTNVTRYSDDGYIRNALVSVNVGGIEMDSFAVAIYKMYMDSIGKAYSLPKLDMDNSFAFSYSKKSVDYTIYSFYDVISGQIPASTFRNSIVLVGDYTNENHSYRVPNQKNILMSEIEVQANIVEALLTQKTGQNVPKGFLACFYGIFVGFFFIATLYSSGLRTIIASFLLIMLQIVSCYVLNYGGYYVPVLIPILFVVAIAAINLVLSNIRAKRDKAALEGVFKKYVDKQVVDEIVKDGTIEAKIGVTRKDIAVLFVDIRGFTSLSESLEPEQVVDILNSYLTMVSNAVTKNKGTLDKFIGDAAMAVFNSPSDIDDYVFRAVCTACDIRDGAAMLGAEYQEKYGEKVGFGIGVHCGEAVIGNIGCKSRMDYTAIGDTVNTASRLEGVAKSGQILISGEVEERLRGRIETESEGEVALKGKKEKVPVYDVGKIMEEEKEVKKGFFFKKLGSSL